MVVVQVGCRGIPRIDDCEIGYADKIGHIARRKTITAAACYRRDLSILRIDAFAGLLTRRYYFRVVRSSERIERQATVGKMQ